MKNNREIERSLTILAKSSIFVFIGIFLSKVFIYFYRIIIARYYGPEVYGLFSLSFMIVGFLVAFASFGLSEGILRFISLHYGKKNKDEIRYLVKISTKISIISGILFGILLFFCSEFIAKNIFHNLELIFYLKVFSFLIPIQVFTNLYFSIIRAHERITVNSFGAHILQNIIKLIFVIVLIFLGASSSQSISFSYLIGILAGLLFAYFFCKNSLSYIFINNKLSGVEKETLKKSLFSYSWPLVLFTIIGSLMMWTDTFFIGYFKDSYWVGIYNSAIPIAGLLVLFSDIFMQMFFPLITKELSSKNMDVVKELSKQVTKWIFILNLPLTILILLFSGVFINLFFGQEYLPAVNALKLLTIGQFVYSMAIVSNNMLLSKGKSKLILINLIFIGMVNFILNFFLIPNYGINGAAFATSISTVVYAIIMLIENYYFNKIFPFRRKMLSIFLISLIPASILFLASGFVEINFVWLIIFGLLFVLIYLGLIVYTKSFDKNDIFIIKKIFKKI